MARKAKVVKEPRRKPGSGTIRHRAGRAYPFEAAYPLEDGTTRYDSFQSKQEATDHLDRLAAERAKPDGRNLSGGSQTFSTFIQSWLSIKAPGVRAKTLLSYTYLCEMASSEIGALRLDTIKRDAIDRMFGALHARQYKNLKQLYHILKIAFDYAIDLDYITKNPIKNVTVPDVEHKEIVILTEAQRTRVLRLAADEYRPDIPLQPLWHLYSRLGWRKGEGAALRWDDIDLSARTVMLRRSVTNVGADLVTNTPKNKRFRGAPLPDDVLELFEAHRAEQQRRGYYAPNGAVFVDKDGEPVTVQHIQYRWQELRMRAGVPGCTIHGLRHTALFIMEQAGVPESIRMALAGHSSAAMAKKYVNHATIEDIRRHIA